MSPSGRPSTPRQTEPDTQTGQPQAWGGRSGGQTIQRTGFVVHRNMQSLQLLFSYVLMYHTEFYLLNYFEANTEQM